MSIKISNLPLGTANSNAVVPADNAAGTTTEKIKLGDIAALATKTTVGLGKISVNNIVTLNGIDSSVVDFGYGGSILYVSSIIDGGTF